MLGDSNGAVPAYDPNEGQPPAPTGDWGRLLRRHDM